MRLCRFGDGALGLVDGANVRDVTSALDVLPSHRHPFPSHDVLIANLESVVERVRSICARAPVQPLADVTLLSPVANPGKILCAPVTYQQHFDDVREAAQLR